MDTDQFADPFWIALPIREDRSPNELNNVAQLWQTQTDPYHAMNQSNPIFYKTQFGNINGDGNPTSFSSPILGLKNDQLESALEPRIAPLVKFLIGLGFATYSSCEGHLIYGLLYEAYAGILYKAIDHSVIRTLFQIAEAAGFSIFRARLVDSDDGDDFETIEIYYINKDNMCIEVYHQGLAGATSRLIALYEKTSK